MESQTVKYWNAGIERSLEWLRDIKGVVISVIGSIIVYIGANLTLSKALTSIDLVIIPIGIFLIGLGVFYIVCMIRERKKYPFMKGVSARLFFPPDTPPKNKTLKYHKENFHHRLIINSKTNPKKAWYIPIPSYAWNYIKKHPSIWLSEIETSDINDPDFTGNWSEKKGYELITDDNAAKEDLEKSD